MAASKNLLLLESHRRHLSPPAAYCGNTREKSSTREAGLRLEVKDIYAGLVGTFYPANNRFSPPEEKQVFNTKHAVCTNSLGTVYCSYHLEKVLH